MDLRAQLDPQDLLGQRDKMVLEVLPDQQDQMVM